MENRKILEDYRKEEWINGEWYMSPRPTPNHSRVHSELTFQIISYLRDKECELFNEPNLVLKNSEDWKTYDEEQDKYISPDLLIICEDNYEEIGANLLSIPDFIAEIVSPGSIKMDYNIKKDMYLNTGVKEYWVVDPLKKIVTVWFDGKSNEYTFNDKIKVNIFESLEIDLSKVKLK